MHLQSIVPKAVQSTPIAVQSSAALALYKSPQLSPIMNHQDCSSDVVKWNYSKRDKCSLSELIPVSLSSWLGGEDTVMTEPRSEFSDWLGASSAVPDLHSQPQDLNCNRNERNLQDQLQIDELQQGLENILLKLKNMLDSNFSLSGNYFKKCSL